MPCCWALLLCCAVLQEYDKYDQLHATFWAALRPVADAELADALKRDAADRATLVRKTGGGRCVRRRCQSGVHPGRPERPEHVPLAHCDHCAAPLP